MQMKFIRYRKWEADNSTNREESRRIENQTEDMHEAERERETMADHVIVVLVHLRASSATTSPK